MFLHLLLQTGRDSRDITEVQHWVVNPIQCLFFLFFCYLVPFLECQWIQLISRSQVLISLGEPGSVWFRSILLCLTELQLFDLPCRAERATVLVISNQDVKQIFQRYPPLLPPSLPHPSQMSKTRRMTNRRSEYFLSVKCSPFSCLTGKSCSAERKAGPAEEDVGRE